MAKQHESTAALSQDGVYRYELTRRWGPGVLLRWVMLNPSTADASVDDPTIRRCCGFAKAWNFAGIVVHNLYALRATDPKALRTHSHPIGPDNNRYLCQSPLSYSDGVICAWGANAEPERARAVVRMFADTRTDLYCLGTTKAGHPKHPLYLPTTSRAVPFGLSEVAA